MITERSLRIGSTGESVTCLQQALTTAGYYSGAISGTGQLWKLGAGEAILSGVNTYSGNTNVSAGTLTINGSVTSPTVTVFNGGTLTTTGTVTAATLSNAATVNANGGAVNAAVTNTGTYNVGGSVSGNGTFALQFKYEIDKKAEGIYALLDLKCSPAAVAELDRQLSLNEAVLRTKVMRLDSK